jgi:Tol biopolymer transport system component
MNTTLLRAAAFLAAASPLFAQQPQPPHHNMFRFPPTGGDRIRTEAHLLPEVSTGPFDPSWSPDGKWIAVAMHGDIWKVPVEGGLAVALTKGPAYHFEPAWSPDGRYVAFSEDLNRNLEIGIVPAEGGEEKILASHPQVDIEPAWAADSKSLYFASARTGRFLIYKVALDAGAVAPLGGPETTQLQPALSSDGKSIAYMSPVRGRDGTGGIWRKALPDGEPQLVQYDETEFHAKPKWSPDGLTIVYSSDDSGSYDVIGIPSQGGSPARLTFDSGDEFSPVFSPDGKRSASGDHRRGRRPPPGMDRGQNHRPQAPRSLRPRACSRARARWETNPRAHDRRWKRPAQLRSRWRLSPGQSSN